MSSGLSRLRALARNLLRRGTIEADLDDEVRAHVELLVAQHVADGMNEASLNRAGPHPRA